MVKSFLITSVNFLFQFIRALQKIILLVFAKYKFELRFYVIKHFFNSSRNRFQLVEIIKEYKPLSQVDVSCARILLLGHINVGKSSFFNTVNSIFRNHVTAQAPVGSPRDQRSITTKVLILMNTAILKQLVKHYIDLKAA